jgi:predicted glycogen debranching enzyme
VPQRFDEAKRVLEVFAKHQKNGIIPNRFDDRDQTAHYNTVDASLWFIQAAGAYAKAARDVGVAEGPIGKACEQVIEAYARGTDFGIRVDPADGLVTAGDANTQLTWMDAKRDGVVFTPRPGKCIEINALWQSGLMEFSALIEAKQAARAAELREMAAKAAKSMRAAFWNEKAGCLFDRLEPGKGGRGWTPSAEIRPNQIFAVSLSHSPR